MKPKKKGAEAPFPVQKLADPANVRKGKKYRTQKKRVIKVFQERPATMLEATVQTGVLRANICRYVAHWRKHGQIVLVRKGICPISKNPAGFYQAAPELF